MKVYLAGEAYGSKVFPQVRFNFNRLETFWSIYNKAQVEENISLYNDFLLDSGAFTFIMASRQGKDLKIDIDYFTDAYCDYINSFKVTKFFEMDVDAVYGYDKVLQLRKRIEQRTGRRPIIVFHKGRGWDEYTAHCRDYDYIALGIAGKDTAWGDWKTFYKFVEVARTYDVKVHGLGITGMKVLEKVPFYSVDSSSWTSGNRYKAFHLFDGRSIKSIPTRVLKDKFIHNHEGLALHNLSEWIKFGKYMENRCLI